MAEENMITLQLLLFGLNQVENTTWNFVGVYRSKKARFPKGKKDSGPRTVVEEGEEEDGGPILSTDPRLAAKNRAMLRTVLNEQLLSSEDVSLGDDVVAAEVEVCCSAIFCWSSSQLDFFRLSL